MGAPGVVTAETLLDIPTGTFSGSAFVRRIIRFGVVPSLCLTGAAVATFLRTILANVDRYFLRTNGRDVNVAGIWD